MNSTARSVNVCMEAQFQKLIGVHFFLDLVSYFRNNFSVILEIIFDAYPRMNKIIVA